MNFNYKLPKVQELDGLSVLNTPVAATDVVLASGVLTIKDESGADAIALKACDLLGFRYNAYTAGTANVVDVELAAITFPVNGNVTYALTISAPYVQNFFGGGQETKAVYIPRTYTVSVDATPTVAELQAAFIARINADPSAYFTASSTGTKVRVTANSALAGELFVEAPTGAVVSVSTAWVAPAGTTTEVLGYLNNATIVTGPSYNRYIIEYRKVIRHNAVSGLGVIRKSTALVYLKSTDAGTAATVTKLTSILDGSYATVAGYLGCPAI